MCNISNFFDIYKTTKYNGKRKVRGRHGEIGAREWEKYRIETNKNNAFIHYFYESKFPSDLLIWCGIDITENRELITRLGSSKTFVNEYRKKIKRRKRMKQKNLKTVSGKKWTFKTTTYFSSNTTTTIAIANMAITISVTNTLKLTLYYQHSLVPPQYNL